MKKEILRKVYSTPKLKEIGKVKEETKGGSIGGFEFGFRY